MPKIAKILFFIDGPMPSEKDYEEAEKIGGARVVFRNGLAVPADGALEECDGVAGNVPERYKEAYPDAKTAIASVKKANGREKANADELVGENSQTAQTAPQPNNATAQATNAATQGTKPQVWGAQTQAKKQ